VKRTENPLVSVIILYYKRATTILETLDSVARQDYPNREVILVDNHSEDNLKELIAPYHSAIRLIELSANSGATGGRNAGIRAAHGEILVFLDDDMSFLSDSELTSIVEMFDRRPNVHVLALKVCDPDTGELRLREWCHPRSWEQFSETEFETHYFCEGASALRRTVFDACGLYYEPLFFGAEGHDLAVRVLDRAFRMLYCPQLRIGHRAAQEGRTLERQYYSYTRNFIWMAYKDYHVLDGIRFLVPMLLMMFYFTVRSGAYGAFFRGISHGFSGLKQIHADRTPISKETVKYYAKLEEWRPGVLVRLRRHRAEPQL